MQRFAKGDRNAQQEISKQERRLEVTLKDIEHENKLI